MSLPRLYVLAATGAALVIANFALAEIKKGAAQTPQSAPSIGPSIGQPIGHQAGYPIDKKIDQQAAISELRFQDIFKLPIGENGPEPTEKLLALNHQRVRITGYQVKGETRAGIFMLTPNPVDISAMEDHAPDELPAATLFAHMSVADATENLAYRTGPRELTGVLDIGNQLEANGRVSFVRLHVDLPVL